MSEDKDEEIKQLKSQLQQKENIIKEVREDLYQVVKWCTENKHNENTIKRYLVVDYGTIVGKINEIRTKLDKEVIKVIFDVDDISEIEEEYEIKLEKKDKEIEELKGDDNNGVKK